MTEYEERLFVYFQKMNAEMAMVRYLIWESSREPLFLRQKRLEMYMKPQAVFDTQTLVHIVTGKLVRNG